MERGRRCLDIDLQEPWSTKGLYTITDSNEVGITITHKFSQRIAQIPWAQVPECKSLDELVVSSNYSESVAVLDLQAGTLNTCTLLAPFFESQVIEDGFSSTITPVKLRSLGSKRANASPHPMIATKIEP